MQQVIFKLFLTLATLCSESGVTFHSEEPVTCVIAEICHNQIFSRSCI